MTITLLNAALIRARRLEVGISERKLAALLGVSQATVRGIEAGINHKDLPLGTIAQLADLLSVSVHDLLTAPTPAPAPAVGPDTERAFLDHHVAQAGALLWDVDRLIPVEAVAATLGLTLDQTETVLAELDQRLAPVGLFVHRLTNTVKIWRHADAVSRDTLAQAWRGHLARRGLDIGQAHLLHKALTGRKKKTLTNDEQVTTNELVNAGILNRTAAGGVELADDVRYSLMLTR